MLLLMHIVIASITCFIFIESLVSKSSPKALALRLHVSMILTLLTGLVSGFEQDILMINYCVRLGAYIVFAAGVYGWLVYKKKIIAPNIFLNHATQWSVISAVSVYVICI